jgi:hypothetical protein
MNRESAPKISSGTVAGIFQEAPVGPLKTPILHDEDTDRRFLRERGVKLFRSSTG